MKAVPADCLYLYQGVKSCMVIGDQETPTTEEIMKFAVQHEAKTYTGLYLVSFPSSEPGQTLLSSAQLDAVFAPA